MSQKKRCWPLLKIPQLSRYCSVKLLKPKDRNYRAVVRIAGRESSTPA
jgi:hypothetical protein